MRPSTLGPSPTPPPFLGRSATLRLSAAVDASLGAFVAAKKPRSDPGPLVLAVLAAHVSGAAVHERVLEVWLDALDADAQSGTIVFGTACPMSGLAVAKSVAPPLARVERQLWADVARIWPEDRWRTRDVSWADYDLIRGPSGMLLNLAAAGAPPRRLALRCARHLLALCAADDLAALRLGDGQGGARNRFNEGRINTGVAHGLAGVTIALKTALELGLPPKGKLRAAVARASDWLVSESYEDGRGLRTWAPAGLDGRDPPAPQGRQAWCYGAPGIAWSLWESGRVLGRRDLRDFALGAMASFCAGFEPDRYLDDEPVDRLGLCHGAAGTLAIADCFAVHARFKPARRLASDLERFLLRHLKQVEALSSADTSLLTGASGMLAILLTRRGAPRAWLLPLGLR